MVPALPLLAHRHSSELTAPYDQCVVEQTRAFEVTQQASDWFVGFLAVLAMVLRDILVSIPAVGVARVDLNEPHSSLHHASGQQAALTEVACDRIVDAVE